MGIDIRDFGRFISVEEVTEEAADILSNVRLQDHCWIGKIPNPSYVGIKLTDETTSDISNSGYKIEILMSGANGYTRIYERGTTDSTGLDSTLSSEDVLAGWSKYFEVLIDE